MNLEYGALSLELHRRFPQLTDEKYTTLTGKIDVYDEPFVLYGVIFNHYLIELAEGSNDELKRYVGEFLEAMATSSDSHVTFLLTSELLPTLVRSQPMIDSFWPSLGEATRRRLTHMAPRFLAKVELPLSE